MQKVDYKSLLMVERRMGSDRRKATLKTFLYSVFRGRRLAPQRLEEKNKFFYKDIYDAKLLVIVLLIAALSVTDAGLTLLILIKGGTELNPVMVWALEFSSQTFFVAKYLLTIFGLLTIVVHINFRVFKRIAMPRILVGVLWVYAFLVGYEFSLLMA